VDKIHKLILEFLLAHAPNSPQLQELAQEYGADQDRFEKESSFCILFRGILKKKEIFLYQESGNQGYWRPSLFCSRLSTFSSLRFQQPSLLRH
jgi:hypothetical protein